MAKPPRYTTQGAAVFFLKSSHSAWSLADRIFRTEVWFRIVLSVSYEKIIAEIVESTMPLICRSDMWPLPPKSLSLSLVPSILSPKLFDTRRGRRRRRRRRKSAAAHNMQQNFLKLFPTMKQTVFSATQAVPKPIVCAKPKAPATDALLQFDATTTKVPQQFYQTK